MEFKREYEVEIYRTSYVNEAMTKVTFVEVDKGIDESPALTFTIPTSAVDLNKVYYVTVSTEACAASARPIWPPHKQFDTWERAVRAALKAEGADVE